MENDVARALLNEFHRRVIEESVPRIKKCLDMVEESQVWFRQNDQVNSIGNLILHLTGNARQWILSGLMGQDDHRKRSREFIPDQDLSKKQLTEMLDELVINLEKALQTCNIDRLLEIRRVQVYEESGVSILVHVIEHFSYHTGQITLLTKQMTNRQTGFYEENLEI